ncbi:hypothetical protein GYMLUDRAFT_560083 [Collybiopsis luxurians FD-317 M1]|uniref:Uncharacterized protein n=1 Tax=Collybiopsis luxurians FD-317 M1 TaxID=944289 RepID=A0A0D0CRS6_9AGAR|nr:hypothetical protein GYMLUDRAFT_560083 [Collybiopsis luxurians FD-317 M1]
MVVSFDGELGGRGVIEVSDNVMLVPTQGSNPQAHQFLSQRQARNLADDKVSVLMEDSEAGVEDDMGGAMKAISLKGLLYGLVQNTT